MTTSTIWAPLDLLAPARLTQVHEIREMPTCVPDHRGVYGWWFDTPLPHVPDKGVISREGWSWLYVGIAGSGEASVSTLRKRLLQHCRGPSKTSTLRRTLGALLDLKRRRGDDGKVYLEGDGETELTAWMIAHARVAWFEDTQPWILEDRLIESGLLPLNIRGATGEHVGRLKAARRA